MMLWAALLAPDTGLPAAAMHWAQQFTPRVTWHEEALLLELSASVRLFGGRRALRSRLRAGARQWGSAGAPWHLAWAPTGLGALALGRVRLDNGFARPLPELLDPLPLACLSALRPHAAMLHLIGCRSLGALRSLPREGLARRLDEAALRALDQAYGEQVEAYAWVEPPEQFRAQVELSGRADDVSALMAGAQRLLLSLTGWLVARNLGVSAFTLRWHHDSMRARSIAPSDTLTLRTAIPSRDAHHLARLLAEHLARVVLPAPVATLHLQADEVQPVSGHSTVFWPGQAQQEASLQQLLERVSARLGPERVLRGQWREDHRPDRMLCWVPATARPVTPSRAPVLGATRAGLWPAGPQPSLLLPEPLPLRVEGHRPHYQGPLRLLLGPQRVEAGWWEAEEAHGGRDYWVAESARAGVLWVFQTRAPVAHDADAWYLHGFFA